jgi:hypothetical protein
VFANRASYLPAIHKMSQDLSSQRYARRLTSVYDQVLAAPNTVRPVPACT